MKNNSKIVKDIFRVKQTQTLKEFMKARMDHSRQIIKSILKTTEESKKRDV